MFDRLKARADRSAADAAWLRGERNARARRGYQILRRRIGSPAGLVACFGAGVFAGARSRREDRGGCRPGTTENGFAGRFLSGPLGAAAIRLGSSFLVSALLEPGRAGSGEIDPGGLP